ncbi:MAG: 4-hydroxy-tetrahydrodipicolinate reductase [Lunatimonas sp.]|uniref:4-hydroxy-tetrahydrodipicolinate reductase n=1 Tax=Lunatimonas sp. TaxID=2060141 RepID=UPI00263B05A8|nr:4-hydroxy-tetrahydrodipicolinate reductase [Lunatimonas sp.]MCC5937664.1 4-hydroxy-tetrahydrodipicolinate reductase [Lunatimonas sp.]
MNILILGYGKMGKIIGEIAEERGHRIVAKINIENIADLDRLDPASVDVAIEFSQPESAYANILWCVDRAIPVLSGTTGWLDKKPAVEARCKEMDGTFFYASNYSVGVNIFFRVNRFLSNLMKGQQDYHVSMVEIHHTEKKDAPSGTAISLAEGVLEHITRLSGWRLVDDQTQSTDYLPIAAKRIDPAPGTHIVTYSSEIDDIEIKHTAHSRRGFAQGAVLVAEWIKDKKGILSMEDFLNL